MKVEESAIERYLSLVKINSQWLGLSSTRVLDDPICMITMPSTESDVIDSASRRAIRAWRSLEVITSRIRLLRCQMWLSGRFRALSTTVPLQLTPL
jgi:hypothetical protein